MSESRFLEVRNESDVIIARMQTRQMAKDAGLSIMDQARISLAVSSVAHLIRMGDSYPGQIVLNRIAGEQRNGVQVIWKMNTECDFDTILQDLKNSTLYMMVHELDTQVSRETGVHITAMMWTPPPTRIVQEEVG